ncbi:MAG: nicotinamide-nucleotide amidohydrolase family protein [Alphaproteobacteria bacterium]|nr:nicotinamide-nucleotide amidohydrolase family protein [Alphaproteobacteria bacterium]
MIALPDRIERLAGEAIAALIARKATVVTAESCTGGLIAGALTSVSGSSAAVHGGFVTYANAAKEQMLGVRPQTLAAHGAVSAETAREMAEGAQRLSGADFAVAVTGIAGPDGGTEEKPVGLVWFGLAGPGGTAVEKRLFGAIGRAAVREATVLHALAMLKSAAEVS